MPVIAGNRIVHHIDWEFPGGVLAEERRMVFLADPDGARMIDFTSRFSAPASRAVTLGDTKEAGIVAVRVAASMSATPVITASSGCTGEPGCWGKAATWCDLAGPAGDRIYGVAVIASSSNPLSPPRWHVRAYGLLAVNPFGLSAFNHAPAGTGDFTIAAGTSVVFRHRIIIHRGDAVAAGIAAKARVFEGAATPGDQP
jgi:hypothetical protein